MTNEQYGFLFRVVMKLGAAEPFVLQTDSKSRALEVAQIQLDTHSTEATRTGSLRGDGEVYMWKDGERIGYVRVEERVHGVFRRIG